MFTRYGSGWEFLAQHPRLLKIVLAALVVAVIALMVRRSARENEAGEDFLRYCLERGQTENACDDRLERNHKRCFGMSYEPGRRFRRGDFFDRERYLECVLVSPEVWSARQRRLLEQGRRQSQ